MNPESIAVQFETQRLYFSLALMWAAHNMMRSPYAAEDNDDIAVRRHCKTTMYKTEL